MFDQFMWTDYVLLIIILVSTLMSLKKTFLQQALSLISLVIAIFVAIRFSDTIGAMINSVVGEGTLDNTLALAGTFFIVFITLSKLGGKLVTRYTGIIKGFIDRILGILFGFVRGVFVASVVVGLALFSPYTKGDTWLHTPVTSKLQPISNMFMYYIPPELVKMLKGQVKELEQSDLVNQSKKLLNAMFGMDLDIRNPGDNTDPYANLSSDDMETEIKRIKLEIEQRKFEIQDLQNNLKQDEEAFYERKFGPRPKYTDRQILNLKEKEMAQKKEIDKKRKEILLKRKELEDKLKYLDSKGG